MYSIYCMCNVYFRVNADVKEVKYTESIISNFLLCSYLGTLLPAEIFWIFVKEVLKNCVSARG